VGWDVSLMLRVVGRAYGYRKRRDGYFESVLVLCRMVRVCGVGVLARLCEILSAE
jgi:hypothetical protein